MASPKKLQEPSARFKADAAKVQKMFSVREGRDRMFCIELGRMVHALEVQHGSRRKLRSEEESIDKRLVTTIDPATDAPLTGVLVGDCRVKLHELGDKIAQLCICSVPYHGMRDHGHPQQIGNDDTVEEYIGTPGAGRVPRAQARFAR
jgi:hypothetical protein